MILYLRKVYKIMDDFDKYINSIVNNIENTKLNKIKNNIYLSNEQIEILKRNEIDYLKFNNMSELIFEIEDLLNSGYDSEELEDLSAKLQEINYYNNTNK